MREMNREEKSGAARRMEKAAEKIGEGVRDAYEVVEDEAAAAWKKMSRGVEKGVDRLARAAREHMADDEGKTSGGSPGKR